MANIIPLKDNTGAQFYPQTHEKAVVDSNGVNLQTKLASITTPTYVTAWDGASTPVVANIPSGVTVTYGGTSYTGTLAASASTANKTYLVSAGSGNYNRYVTQLNGSTYSWQNIGSTEIDLSDYATKEELGQLDQKVDDLTKDVLQADFTIADENRNAIAKFVGGHIKTKNFDSSVLTVDETEGADLEVQDAEGHVLVAFADGGIKTKYFDSSYIQRVISRYRGKRLSILGDSLSTYGVPDATNEDGTYCYSYYPNASCRYSENGNDSIKFDVNDTYWMRLINATGMRLGINDSYRGTRVSGTNNALSLQTRIDHLKENGLPNVILVLGGGNDAGNNVEIGTFNTENPKNYTDEEIAALPVTTFADAYRTMLIRLMKTYPLSEIVVVLPTYVSSYYTIDRLDLYAEVIKEACDFFGIKWIDARCTGINVFNYTHYLTADNIHPNAEGMRLIFEKIYRQLIFA